MQNLKEQRISSFQLKVLLNEQEKESFELLLHEGVYCTHCNAICKDGVDHYSTRLDVSNNLVINGECATCGNRVCKVMEFGEEPVFFAKALEFRKVNQN
jgi:hypothetical protein